MEPVVAICYLSTFGLYNCPLLSSSPLRWVDLGSEYFGWSKWTLSHWSPSWRIWYVLWVPAPPITKDGGLVCLVVGHRLLYFEGSGEGEVGDCSCFGSDRLGTIGSICTSFLVSLESLAFFRSFYIARVLVREMVVGVVMIWSIYMNFEGSCVKDLLRSCMDIVISTCLFPFVMCSFCSWLVAEVFACWWSWVNPLALW